MNDDAIGINAVLYTVSEIAQDTVKKGLARSGARKSNCCKYLYRVEGVSLSSGHIGEVEIGQCQQLESEKKQ